MSYTYVATAILSAALSFGSAWKVQQWRFDAHEKQAIEQAAIEQQDLHKLEQARSSAALAVQVLARKSEAILRHDAAASQSAYVSLRGATDQALRTASTNLETCLAVSTAASELFLDSAEAYRELATKADEHLIDLRTQLDTP